MASTAVFSRPDLASPDGGEQRPRILLEYRMSHGGDMKNISL